MQEHEDLRRRNLVAYARWRLLFAGLAVVVPLAFFGLFRRQELRLRGLADHGRPATAVIEEVVRRQGVAYAHYRYAVEGASYTWSVSREEAPYAPGESFAITYLPEDASLSRPGAYSRERLDAELDLPFQHRLLAGFFLVFAVAAGLCHRGLRRLQSDLPSRTGPLLTPVAAGRLVALLLLGAVLASSFDEKVRAVQVALFGSAPLGLPVTLVVSVATTALFAPFFWVFPHLMGIVMDARARGASLSRIGIVVAVARAGPELRRSRAIVIAGFLYFVILVVAWIAFTESRGV